MATKVRTVAIVEDDSELRDSIRTFVEEAGWKLTGVFPNAEKALPVLEKEVPDVILMDIQLPGTSGIELTRHLKGLHEDVAILMLTVYDKTELVFEAIAAGASGYLLKRDVPIRLRHLKNKATSQAAASAAPRRTSGKAGIACHSSSAGPRK